LVTASREEQRFRELFQAGLALNSELSLDALLQRITEVAASITQARYAALGVIDETGEALERFVVTGIDEEQEGAIGDFPRGRGILGVLIRHVAPLRLASIGDDERSVGFPPNHPPMTTFLGVPVVLRGVAYGNLYLTEKEGGVEFTDEDEATVTLLAAQAAIAIENARLYESATRWSRQLESLHDVVRSLVGELDLQHLLELVCARLRELIGARLALVALSGGADTELRITAVDGDTGSPLVGAVLGRSDSKAGRVLARRQSARVDSLLDDPEVTAEETRQVAARTGLYVPLVTGSERLGVIAVHDKIGRNARFTDEDLRLAEIFAGRVAVAVSLSQRVARDTVRRVVEAQESERKRLALELHDETGQALTSILLGLKAIRAADGDEAAARAEADVRALVVQALQDVRALAVELRPSALDDFGLVPALQRLAETFGKRSGITTVLETSAEGRLPTEVETTLYRVVQEALTNVIKHSGAEHVSIVVSSTDSSTAVTIEDDGRGFDPQDVRLDALGLLGMRERLALVGGSLTVESGGDGTGTTVAARVPATPRR
jgi:two-component system, NarL family, sensor histidine kinase DevS